MDIFDEVADAFADIPSKVAPTLSASPSGGGFFDHLGDTAGALLGLTADAYARQWVNGLPGYAPPDANDGEVTPSGLPSWAWLAIAGLAIAGIALVVMRK